MTLTRVNVKPRSISHGRPLPKDKPEEDVAEVPNSKSIKDMVNLYNSLVPAAKRVTKFKDKATAQRRLAQVLGEEEEKRNTKALAPKKPLKTIKLEEHPKQIVTGNISSDDKNITLDLTVSESIGIEGVKRQIVLVGRKSYLKGKFLYKIKENPRRAETRAWHSYNVLKDGMTYEQFVLARGNTRDLRWDIDHGVVEALDKPRSRLESRG